MVEKNTWVVNGTYIVTWIFPSGCWMDDGPGVPIYTPSLTFQTAPELENAGFFSYQVWQNLTLIPKKQGPFEGWACIVIPGEKPKSTLPVVSSTPQPGPLRTPWKTGCWKRDPYNMVLFKNPTWLGSTIPGKNPEQPGFLFSLRNGQPSNNLWAAKVVVPNIPI